MKLTDWQALDARIAGEAMGLHIFVPISGGREWRDDEGTSHYGVIDAGYSHSPLPPWQPHQDVAQALQAVQRLLDDDAYLALCIYGKKRWWLATLEQYTEDGPVSLRGEQVANCAQAICAVLKKWLDAQGMPDGE